jgi:alpha-tubulin suppressor-like RCC1 family protein
VGSNAQGELGQGTTGGASGDLVLLSVGGLVSATTRSYHTCAARTDNAAVCWGSNDQGQIGDNTMTLRNAPTTVMNLQTTGMIGTGRAFSCAQRLDGLITCWGGNASGQLGDGSTTPRMTPSTTIALPATPTALAVGSSTACVVLPDRTARCWGDNEFGQLGNNSTTNAPTPITPPVTGIAQIVTGGYNIFPDEGSQTCAVQIAGNVKCWGSNDFGQLGLGTTSTTPALIPQDVTMAPAGVVELAMGRYHVCTRNVFGAVHCWGRNEVGQVGDGTQTLRSAPTAVSLPRPALHIAAGGWHTCALLDDGTARCWGENGSRQLGDDSVTDRFSPAVTAICE